MLYILHFPGPQKRQAQIETWDGKVVKATPSMRWAIGKRIEWLVQFWLPDREIEWRLYRGPASPELSDKTLDQVTDSELMENLKS